MNEFTALYEIFQKGYLEDRLQYALEDWALSYKDCDPKIMFDAVRVMARHPDANVARVLRVLNAWTLQDLKFLVDLLK